MESTKKQLLIKNRVTEHECMIKFMKMLISKGYPAQSINLEQFISPGKFADMAIYNESGNEIRAIVEFKVSQTTLNWRRRLRDALEQLLGYIESIPQNKNIRAFIVTYPQEDLVESFEIYELISSLDRVISKQIREFPIWTEINNTDDLSLELPLRHAYKGSFSEQREKLSRAFSIVRHGLPDQIEFIEHTGRSDPSFDLFHSIIGEIYSQLFYSFSDLGTQGPWRSPQHLFLSVAMFYTQLDALEARLEDINPSSKINPKDLIRQVIKSLKSEIRGVLDSPAIATMKPVSSWLSGQSRALKDASGRPRKSVDLLIITAMFQPEYEEVLALLNSPTVISPFSQANSAICYEGFLSSEDSTHKINVVAATQNDMGLTNAAVLATKLITHFKPKYVAMVGIAAGVDAKSQKVGDILCASHTYDIAMGKLERKELGAIFKPKIFQISVKDHFNQFSFLHAAKQEKDLLKEVKLLWNKRHLSSPLKSAPELHIGPFGSGGTVIADPVEVNIYKNVNNALIGFDMEAHAIVTASAECGLNEKPQVVIFKSICDFAGEDKSKRKDFKQRLAAFTSAQFLRLFFLKYVFGNS